MGQRLELQSLFELLIENENVYFQPPATTSMKYPCIVYERDDIAVKFADNLPHIFTKRYQVTVIDRNPDSLIPDKIAVLPMCLFSRHFVVNNLNHDVFTLYF